MFFIKPQIKLPALPIINIWLQKEYDLLQSEADVIEFIFKKQNEIEITNNVARIKAIEALINPLYSILTNKSYQSKISI